MMRLRDLRQLVRDRLGDGGAVWTDAEIDLQLQEGYEALASAQDVFFDFVYLENLPAVASYNQPWEARFLPSVRLTRRTEASSGFSCTQPWEQGHLTRLGFTNLGWSDYTAQWEPDHVSEAQIAAGMCKRGPGRYTNSFEDTDGFLTTLGLPSVRSVFAELYGGLDAGHANTTASFELALARDVADERTWTGPAVANHEFEVTETFLTRSGAAPAIPATAEVPEAVVQLTRATWDRRGIDLLDPRTMQQVDSRYEVTVGEVYGLMWRKDGVRTIRKVRVPGTQSDSITLDEGNRGAIRDCADLSGDSASGTWGTPRRIPGHHPIGGGVWGTARRPYLDGHNVRLEVFRLGAPMDTAETPCELPDRYALYLRDFAQGQLLQRNGPGQDRLLAQHFLERWARGLTRIERRRQHVNVEHSVIIGGEDRGLARRPPRPSLPWPYGREVR
jgi:hypothetical protein